MRPLTSTDERQQDAIARITRAAEGDERVRAAWLAGSYADGTGGPWSDLDVYLAIEDGAFEDFDRRVLEWVEEHIDRRFGRIAARFGAARMYGMTLASGVRLDLFVEPVSTVHVTPRPVAVRPLLDRDGLIARLDVRRPVEMEAPATIGRLVDGYFFGSTFPVRLSGREEWGSLLANAMLVVYQFIVPAILAQERPEHTYRPQLHNERFLPPARRREVDALVGDLARAFAGLGAKGATEPDGDAVRAAHERLLSTAVREFRAACAATGVPWPQDAEAWLRAFLRDELAVDLA